MRINKKIIKPLQFLVFLACTLTLIFTFQHFYHKNENISMSSANNKSSDSQIKVVTSFCAVHSMAKNLLEGIPNVEIVTLGDYESECPHERSLSPNDIKILEDADIFIKYGAGLDNNFDKVMESVKKNHQKLRVIDVSSEIPETHSHDWLSIDSTIVHSSALRNNLINLFPGQREKINQNTENYIQKLNNIKTEMYSKCSKFIGSNFATNSDTLYHFLSHNNLKVKNFGSQEHDQELSTRDMVEIIKEIKKNNIKLFFIEQDSSRKLVNSLKKEVNVDCVKLVTQWPPENDFIDCIKQNMDVLESL